MADPDDKLRAFIARAEAEPFRYGAWDCCLWLADWGLELTGIDGGAAWRGRYRTALGCMRLLTREGGVRAVVERGALACGMRPVDRPVAGAVGVVDALTPMGRRDIGALFTGRHWIALRQERGVLTLNRQPSAIWAV